MTDSDGTQHVEGEVYNTTHTDGSWNNKHVGWY